ncbi:MAG: hypothetical protein AAGU21_13950 [Solidesulfovibrio sp.]|uniref:hypothetical protein n=1 Tax=Solidesulfovibrio sp. TaxID=2910990 RepID=UPI0031580DFE
MKSLKTRLDRLEQGNSNSMSACLEHADKLINGLPDVFSGREQLVSIVKENGGPETFYENFFVFGGLDKLIAEEQEGLRV